MMSHEVGRKVKEPRDAKAGPKIPAKLPNRHYWQFTIVVAMRQKATRAGDRLAAKRLHII